MYPQANFTYPKQLVTLKEWSFRVFRTCMFTKRERKDKESATSETHQLVHQHCPSLKKLGLPLYKPYTDIEKSILLPATSWTLRIPLDCSKFDIPVATVSL